MTTTVYRSTDGGAPKLSSQPGSLIEVLDYCLLSSGWTRPFFKADGNVPYGFVGAVYRQGGGNQYYLKVDDEFHSLPPPTSGNNSTGNAAIVTGYKSMSSYTSGTNPFPNVKNYVPVNNNQFSPGLIGNNTNIYFRKASLAVAGTFSQSGSFTASYGAASTTIVSTTRIEGVLMAGTTLTCPFCAPTGTVLSFIDPFTATVSLPTAAPGVGVTVSYTQSVAFVPWTIIATDKAFYMYVAWGSATTLTMVHYFGDFESDKLGDTNNCILIGTVATSGAFLINPEFNNVTNTTQFPDSAISIPSSSFFDYNPMSPSRAKDCGVDGINALSVGNSATFGLSYPDPATSHLFLSPIFLLDQYNVSDGSRYSSIRGTLPGAWSTESSAFVNFAKGDTFTGTGDLAGKSFEFFNLNNTSLVALETSSTW